MKITTSLYYVIQAQLKRMGYNEYVNNGLLTLNDRERRILSALFLYEDETIIRACRGTIFFGLDFLSEKTRKTFEKEFISRFIYHNFKYQTYELSNAHLISICSQYKDILEMLYTNSNELLQAQELNTNNNSSDKVGRNNNLYSDMPQNQVNISLDAEDMEYATNTTLTKFSDTEKSKSDSKKSSFDITNLNNFMDIKKNIFNEIDIKLFSQIY